MHYYTKNRFQRDIFVDGTGGTTYTYSSEEKKPCRRRSDRTKGALRSGYGITNDAKLMCSPDKFYQRLKNSYCYPRGWTLKGVIQIIVCPMLAIGFAAASIHSWIVDGMSFHGVIDFAILAFMFLIAPVYGFKD
jgi:hypothetical protein